MFIVEDGTGKEDATSYVDIAHADTYTAFYYPDDVEWSAKSTSSKELALMSATKFVDRLIKWDGEIYVVTQALKWPRTEFKDVDGRIIAAGTIPTKVKEAVVEMALESLVSDIYDQGVLITSQKYGSSSETYSGPVRDGGNLKARRVMKELQDYGYGRSSSSIITTYRA